VWVNHTLEFSTNQDWVNRLSLPPSVQSDSNNSSSVRLDERISFNVMSNQQWGHIIRGS
jgi:hypothetical protein